MSDNVAVFPNRLLPDYQEKRNYAVGERGTLVHPWAWKSAGGGVSDS